MDLFSVNQSIPSHLFWGIVPSSPWSSILMCLLRWNKSQQIPPVIIYQFPLLLLQARYLLTLHHISQNSMTVIWPQFPNLYPGRFLSTSNRQLPCGLLPALWSQASPWTDFYIFLTNHKRRKAFSLFAYMEARNSRVPNPLLCTKNSGNSFLKEKFKYTQLHYNLPKGSSCSSDDNLGQLINKQKQ